MPDATQRMAIIARASDEETALALEEELASWDKVLTEDDAQLELARLTREEPDRLLALDYATGGLSPDESRVFEARLASDKRLRDAAAPTLAAMRRGRELRQHAVLLYTEPSAEAHRLRRWLELRASLGLPPVAEPVAIGVEERGWWQRFVEWLVPLQAWRNAIWFVARGVGIALLLGLIFLIVLVLHRTYIAPMNRPLFGSYGSRGDPFEQRFVPPPFEMITSPGPPGRYRAYDPWVLLDVAPNRFDEYAVVSNPHLVPGRLDLDAVETRDDAFRRPVRSPVGIGGEVRRYADYLPRRRYPAPVPIVCLEENIGRGWAPRTGTPFRTCRRLPPWEQVWGERYGLPRTPRPRIAVEGAVAPIEGGAR